MSLIGSWLGARLVVALSAQTLQYCTTILLPAIAIFIILNRNIGKEEKIKIVEETFSQKIPKEIIGLMTLLIKKGHAKDMCAVFKYFIGLVKEEKKIGSARVVTAIELSGEQKEKVEQKLLETTSYEKFEMNYEVDSSLIGGMVIRIGDRIVDSSIRTKLYELSKNLRKIQL